MLKPLPNNTSVEDRELFEGAWSNNEGQCHVKFDSKGFGRMASLEWDDEKEVFNVDGGAFVLTKLKEEFYLSAYNGEDAKGETVLAKCALIEGDLLIWGADVKRFEELVKQGKLLGDVAKGDHGSSVTLKSSPGDLSEVLKSEKNLFFYKEPMVLRKHTK